MRRRKEIDGPVTRLNIMFCLSLV